MTEGMTFKARATKDVRQVNKKKGVSAAQDEKSESAATRKAEQSPKKKVANKNNMRAAAVAMAKKSNLTGNPGAKAAALRRVAKGK